MIFPYVYSKSQQVKIKGCIIIKYSRLVWFLS